MNFCCKNQKPIMNVENKKNPVKEKSIFENEIYF